MRERRKKLLPKYVIPTGMLIGFRNPSGSASSGLTFGIVTSKDRQAARIQGEICGVEESQNRRQPHALQCRADEGLNRRQVSKKKKKTHTVQTPRKKQKQQETAQKQKRHTVIATTPNTMPAKQQVTAQIQPANYHVFQASRIEIEVWKILMGAEGYIQFRKEMEIEVPSHISMEQWKREKVKYYCDEYAKKRKQSQVA